MFRLKYKKASTGEIRVTNKRYRVNYIKPLRMSKDTVRSSILHFS